MCLRQLGLDRYRPSRCWRNLKDFYLRGRDGWAPSDTWSLDTYLSSVLGGSLTYLAQHSQSAPLDYPTISPAHSQEIPTNQEAWKHDLIRWATAFADYARDDYYDLYGEEGESIRWSEDEANRMQAVKTALIEMAPWFTFLWD